jgi:hypothetical protein
MSSSSDESSSYEESDSSDVASDKVWTCDDIYPAKANKASDSDEYSSSSEQSIEKPQKLKGKTESQAYSSSSDSDEQSSEESESESSDDNSDSIDVTPSRASERPKVQRHSSGEIEVHLTAQSKAIANAKKAESERRRIIESNNEGMKKREAQAREADKVSAAFENLSKEYDSSDESMESLKRIVAHEHAKKSIESGAKIEEKSKFEKRNLEREMRLAKARERIEKKKDDEAAKEAKERLKDKKDSTTSKLDMSKAARVERAYSWYSRMAMPTREKMKERVEYMPASSGVTPDDVDLLPWNARGTFVSVAAMMRMNRTATSFARKTTTSSISESETDSD